MKNLFFTVSLLIATLCFAVTPNSVTAVNISNTSQLVRRSDVVESIAPCQINYAIAVQYLTVDTLTPIYLQLTADNVPTSFSYWVTLKNVRTNKNVINNIFTRTSRISGRLITSLKAKVIINPSDLYMLQISCPGSRKTTNLIPPFVHYRPILNLYVGAYSKKYATDTSFSE